MNIPFVDLHAQYLRYQKEIDAALADTIAKSAYIGGPAVKDFEAAFSAYSGVSQTIACANGTDSMEMLLDALGVGPGDEVIVPALSWISTAEVVGTRGATPVFVDIDESYTINPELIEASITERTRGIIPVHLYGCPADMPRIMEIAEKNQLFVIEDCAQAHGAAVAGQGVSQFGIAGSYSFYPGKNLGAYGDAGAVVTESEELAHQVRMLANHGQPKKHLHLMEGRNSRMDGLQAAVLNAKLPYLETWTEERRMNAARYHQALKDLPLTLPHEPSDRRHVYHLYVIQSDRRDELMSHLQSQGVACAIHYPTPMPLMPCYAQRGWTVGDFPMAEKACKGILSLPLYPELSEEQIAYVAEQIARFYA